ncbi:MAG: enoyl-CoA hydratase-related protein [Polyangiaceae bacterium]
MSTAAAPEVLVEKLGRSMMVTINRPEARNSLTRGVLSGLVKGIAEASADPDVRCVILTGAGTHFCAGADLRKNLAENPDLFDQLEAYMDEFHGAIKALVRCEKPTIAMLDGAAVGFGADLALACDLRVATTNAYIQEKFVKIGLMPDGGGTFWLPRLVGTARAMQMILLAEKVEGAQLKALGLVVDAVAPEKLREATLAIAKQIEDGPPLAFKEIKNALYASWGDFEDALRREREGQLRLLRSADVIEGIMSWSQKREPNFQGK